MSEDETLDTEDGQQEDHLKVLRKKAKERDELEARALAAERKLALRDAFQDAKPHPGRLKLFEKGYDGDWNDPEAMRAAAIEYGVIDPPEPEIPAEEQAAHERVEQASAGASSKPEEDWDTKLTTAQTEAEFLAAYAQSGRPMSTG